MHIEDLREKLIMFCFWTVVKVRWRSVSHFIMHGNLGGWGGVFNRLYILDRVCGNGSVSLQHSSNMVKGWCNFEGLGRSGESGEFVLHPKTEV